MQPGGCWRDEADMIIDTPAKLASPAARTTPAPRIRIHPSLDIPDGDGIGASGDLAGNAQLPRLHPSVAKSLNRIHAGGSVFEFRSGDAVWHAAWDPDPPPLSMARKYRFQLGEAFGHLVLDPLAERRLIGDMANDVVPPDLRALLLADALDALFPYVEQWSGQPFRFIVVDDQETPAVDPQAACVCLRAQEQSSQAVFHCTVQFDDERHLELLCPSAPAVRPQGTADWNWIPVPLSFRLGATSLKLEELRQIAPGDIVRIDVWRTAGKALLASASLPGSARRTIAAHIVDTKIIVDRFEEDSMSTTKTGDALADRAHPDAMLDDLEALEITLTFELGSHGVTLGELRSLRAGHAIELAQPLQRSTIRIMANGRPVGSGYLIALGDKLGIRISEFAKNDDV
jgi:type III secretion protein Q